MKKLLLLPVAFCLVAVAHAQDNEKVKEVVVTGKRLSDTTIKRINRDHNADQKVITLRFKGEKAEGQKYVIEVDGDKIKVNGKDIADVKDVDVSVGKNRMYFRSGAGAGVQAFGPDGPIPFEHMKELKELRAINGDHVMVQGFRDKLTAATSGAFLGVGMEKADKGVRITSVTEKSAAEKAGLKKDDIIVSVDGKKVEAEMEVTRMIQSHKPGEQVEIAYTRDGKEAKAKAELGKRENEDLSYWYDDGGNNKAFGLNGKAFDMNGKVLELNGKSFDMNQKFDLKLDKMNQFDYKLAPDLEWNGQGKGDIKVVGVRRPRLGVNVKETESGKGLEVTEVTDGSVAAKAGLQKGDIINEVAGKGVSTVEDIRKAVNESVNKPFNVNYTRNGSSKNVEIKFPKELKEGGL